ncbi:MAG: RNA polymerase sigma factor, partial [Neglectibacter sp.]
INYMRKQGRTDGRCCSLEEQEEQDMAIPEPSLDERIMLAEQKERLMQIWSSLPEEDRLLLEGKYILGYTDAELADMLGCKKSSVRMKLTRARRRAFQLMTEEEGDKV